MSIKDYNKCINVIDATTGNVIETIYTRHYTIETLESFIRDLFENDYYEDQHGLLIKYGIKQ